MCWDTYTLVLLGFPHRPGKPRDEVMALLDSSAKKLLEAYPFLAGQVVVRGRTTTSSGKYEIIPYPPHQIGTPVRRKDCTELCPSYQEILEADAPFSMLDGSILCPMRGMGFAYEAGTELPVFIVQANFVKGGIILCFGSMHNALDMNGQGIVLRMFAQAGRGESFDPKVVEIGNRDADIIFPLLGPDEKMLPHENMRRPSTLTPSGPLPSVSAPWTYWRFPAKKLEELKKTASSGRTWVSTNDAITAFFVQRLTAARVAAGRLPPTEDVHLYRAVDGRSALRPPVDPAYLGHLVVVAETSWDHAQAAVDSTLADVAVEVRDSLKQVDDYFVRSLATLIDSMEDKSTIFYGVNSKVGRDFLISSWAQLHWLATCDFGPGLGNPDFVRRANLEEVPILAYIMPKDNKGNMHLAASLFPGDFDLLVKDEQWRKYTDLVG
jgi:trichothecene 3-O-acetyltransferase